MNLSDLFEPEPNLGFQQQNNAPINTSPVEAQPQQSSTVPKGMTMDEFLAEPISAQVKQEPKSDNINSALAGLQDAADVIANLNATVGNPIINDTDYVDLISKDATKIKEIPEDKITKEIAMMVVNKSGYLLFDIPQAVLDEDVIHTAVTTSPELIVKVHTVSKRSEQEWIDALTKQPSLIKQLPEDMASKNLLNTFHTRNKGNQWDTYILEKYASRRSDTPKPENIVHTNIKPVDTERVSNSVEQLSQAVNNPMAKFIGKPTIELDPNQQKPEINEVTPEQIITQQLKVEQLSQQSKPDLSSIITAMSEITGLLSAQERIQEDIKTKIDFVYTELRDLNVK